MNEQLLTATLLLMNGAILSFVLFMVRNNRNLRALADAFLRLEWSEQQQHHKTRRRIAEVKTRLADEERDDHRKKAEYRREVRS